MKRGLFQLFLLTDLLVSVPIAAFCILFFPHRYPTLLHRVAENAQAGWERWR